jgi:hypothetical protein
MWALIDENNKVLACLPPTVTAEEYQDAAKLGRLVEMTLENSPAYINGFYDGKKFYKNEGQ